MSVIEKAIAEREQDARDAWAKLLSFLSGTADPVGVPALLNRLGLSDGELFAIAQTHNLQRRLAAEAPSLEQAIDQAAAAVVGTLSHEAFTEQMVAELRAKRDVEGDRLYQAAADASDHIEQCREKRRELRGVQLHVPFLFWPEYFRPPISQAARQWYRDELRRVAAFDNGTWDATAFNKLNIVNGGSLPAGMNNSEYLQALRHVVDRFPAT
jgi:hypothetical protein